MKQHGGPAFQTSDFRLHTSSALGNRRGMVALSAIIMLSLMVIVALAGHEEMTLEARAAVNRNDIRQAYQCARTGIDYCLYLAGQNTNWRSDFGNGVWVTDYAVGSGLVSVSASDPADGMIGNDPIGIVEFTAAASKGVARRTLIAQAQPPPGEALRYVLCCLTDQEMLLRDDVCVYGDIRTSGNVTLSGTVSLKGNINTLAGAAVSPDLLDGDTAVVNTSGAVQPPPVSLAWYKNIGELVQIPRDGEDYRLRNVRLASDSNPYGFMQSDGVYCFDAGGATVIVSDCYIEGTLVVTNAGKLRIQSGYHHVPGREYYPALLSDSNIEIRMSQPLRESDSNADLDGDGDKSDVFVSQIRGVIYTSARFSGFQDQTATGPFFVSGAVVAGAIEVFGGECHVSYDPHLAATPVAGFQGDGLAIMK